MDVIEPLLIMLALLCALVSLIAAMPGGIAWGLVAVVFALLARQAQASCHHSEVRRWFVLLEDDIMRQKTRGKRPAGGGQGNQ